MLRVRLLLLLLFTAGCATAARPADTSRADPPANEPTAPTRWDRPVADDPRWLPPPPADAPASGDPANAPTPTADPPHLAVPPLESDDPVARIGPPVWGVAGVRGFATGVRVAPNGIGFDPLFSLDLNFNVWLWRTQGLYAFEDTHFWGQRAAPGVTNRAQGVFDFSKREFDQNIGLAWNYYRNLELRAFAYSDNNLNRGNSAALPYGFRDGAGIESRWYVGGSYPQLGQPGFDVARATFLSVGYYPTKTMVDVEGAWFKPGAFARAYLTLDLLGPRCYLYADVQALGDRAMRARQFSVDAGLAVRPFRAVPYLEFRLGSEDKYDVPDHEWATTVYGSVRVIY